MKKILLFAALLPAILFAQIGQIQTHDKPGEFIWHCVYHDKPSDKYYLHAQSDNQYEDKVLRIFLGDNSTDAAKSLSNFLAAFANAGTQFEIGGYTFVVATTGTFVRALNRGGLQYSAGNYYIQKQHIEDAIIFLANSRQADAGRCMFFADNLSAGKLKFNMLDYGVKDGWLNFNTNLKPFLSGKYKRGDALSDDDVCSIRTAILNGQLPKGNIIITQTNLCE